MGIDETVEQSARVEEFQKSDAQFGRLKKPKNEKELAIEIVAAILSEKDFYVLNPFAPLIKQSDIKARNALPMFFTLVSSIAYANRFRRPSFTIGGVEKYIIASLADNVEALEIWEQANKTQGTGLPPSYNELLDSMEMGKYYTVDQLTEEHNRKFPKHKISAKTVSNYLKQLGDKNLVTSARPHAAMEAYDKGKREENDENDQKDRRVGFPRGFVYSRLLTSLTSQLAWGPNFERSVNILDDWKTS